MLVLQNRIAFALSNVPSPSVKRNDVNLLGCSGDLTPAGFGQPTSRARKCSDRVFQLAVRVSFSVKRMVSRSVIQTVVLQKPLGGESRSGEHLE